MLAISTRLPHILAILFTMAMIATTAWQGYDFWKSEPAPSTPTAAPGAPDGRPSQAQLPRISLGSLEIFGSEAQEKAAPEQENLDDLPETNLKLVLRGVMAASGEFPGSALVEDGKRNTEAYVIGEELPGNATLKAVRPDRIVINRSGALESLYFPEDEDRSGIELAANNRDRDNNTAGQDFAEQQARPATFSGPEPGAASDERREEIRRRLEQLRNRLRSN